MSKYLYDPHKLNYSQVGNNLRSKVLKLFSYFFASIIIAFLINVLYAFVFDTPQERQIRQENKALSKDYEYLRDRFAQINTVLMDLREHDENIYRMIFETEPVKRQGVAEAAQVTGYFSNLLEKQNDVLVRETAGILEDVYQGVHVNADEYRNLMALAYSKRDILKNIPAIQPIENKELIRAASGFGYRVHPIYKIQKFHSGIDFTAPIGTPVFATGNGVVETVHNSRRGSGNTIVIDHGFNYKTTYSHLDGFNVRRGQQVSRGDVIAYVGNTGLSVAPHLHYEVLLNDAPVNPVNYFFLELTPEQYDKMIELSIKSGQSFD